MNYTHLKRIFGRIKRRMLLLPTFAFWHKEMDRIQTNNVKLTDHLSYRRMTRLRSIFDAWFQQSHIWGYYNRLFQTVNAVACQRIKDKALYAWMFALEKAKFELMAKRVRIILRKRLLNSTFRNWHILSQVCSKDRWKRSYLTFEAWIAYVEEEKISRKNEAIGELMYIISKRLSAVNKWFNLVAWRFYFRRKQIRAVIAMDHWKQHLALGIWRRGLSRNKNNLKSHHQRQSPLHFADRLPAEYSIPRQPENKVYDLQAPLSVKLTSLKEEYIASVHQMKQKQKRRRKNYFRKGTKPKNRSLRNVFQDYAIQSSKYGSLDKKEAMDIASSIANFHVINSLHQVRILIVFIALLF